MKRIGMFCGSLCALAFFVSSSSGMLVAEMSPGVFDAAMTAWMAPVGDYLAHREARDSRIDMKYWQYDLQLQPEHYLYLVNSACLWCGCAPAHGYDALFWGLGTLLCITYPCCKSCSYTKGRQGPLQYLRKLVQGEYPPNPLKVLNVATPVAIFALNAVLGDLPLAIFPSYLFLAAVIGYTGNLDRLSWLLDDASARRTLLHIPTAGDVLACCLTEQSAFQCQRTDPNAVFKIWKMCHPGAPSWYDSFRPVPGLVGESLTAWLPTFLSGKPRHEPARAGDPPAPLTRSQLWGENTLLESPQRDCVAFVVEGTQYLPLHRAWASRVKAEAFRNKREERGVFYGRTEGRSIYDLR